MARLIGAWCVRLPPLKQETFYWAREGGEDLAAQAALRAIWTRYLDGKGLTVFDCPIVGLFPENSGGASSSRGS